MRFLVLLLFLTSAAFGALCAFGAEQTPNTGGFSTTALYVTTKDGRNVTVIEPFTFTRSDGQVITVPFGATSDGCSTPPILWPTIPPFGAPWLACVVHDECYRNTERTKHDCDLFLWDAMLVLGVESRMRDAIYEGVKWGGGWAYETDHQTQKTSGEAEGERQ